MTYVVLSREMISIGPWNLTKLVRFFFPESLQVLLWPNRSAIIFGAGIFILIWHRIIRDKYLNTEYRYNPFHISVLSSRTSIHPSIHTYIHRYWERENRHSENHFFYSCVPKHVNSATFVDLIFFTIKIYFHINLLCIWENKYHKEWIFWQFHSGDSSCSGLMGCDTVQS
jgi:hypothetical protein